jgi:glycosyltransferase involved in cell wall biosynthesis
MNKLPKISIVIPSYNKVDYIEETLGSIFIQNYPNLEVIIQDGGSTDGTVDIIKKYAKKYPKVISWTSKKDKGQVDAINKGLRKATGDVVAYINADDVYEKGALKAVGEYFVKNSSTLWLAGRGGIINRDGKQISKWVTSYKNILLMLNRYTFLLIVNYLTQSSVFLSKKAYGEYGPFTGTRRYVMEYDLWLRLGKIEMPKVFHQNLSSFRLSMDNISATQFQDVLSQDFHIVKRFTKNPIALFLHDLHNLGRIGTVNLLKKK